MDVFSCIDNLRYRNLDRRSVTTSMKTGWGGKKGHMVDGWLLTNRKHVGKTMNVSVLKAALKDGRMGGKKRNNDC